MGSRGFEVESAWVQNICSGPGKDEKTKGYMVALAAALLLPGVYTLLVLIRIVPQLHLVFALTLVPALAIFAILWLSPRSLKTQLRIAANGLEWRDGWGRTGVVEWNAIVGTSPAFAEPWADRWLYYSSRHGRRDRFLVSMRALEALNIDPDRPWEHGSADSKDSIP